MYNYKRLPQIFLCQVNILYEQVAKQMRISLTRKSVRRIRNTDGMIHLKKIPNVH